MKETVDFITVNAIPKGNLQIINSFHVRINQTTGIPCQMVLYAALNRKAAHSDCCEFPIYIPSRDTFHSDSHMEMLKLFRSGVPWVPVECYRFKIYRYLNNKHYRYFAYADNFKVISYDKILEV